MIGSLKVQMVHKSVSVRVCESLRGKNVCTCGVEIMTWICVFLVFSVEWSTSMDVVLLKTDLLSENVAAFSKQDGGTDCEFQWPDSH